MKTPIQELTEHFTDAWSSPSDLWKPSKVIDKIESMLEKEKQFLVSQQRKLLDWISNEPEHNIIKSEINEILEDFKYYNETFNTK